MDFNMCAHEFMTKIRGFFGDEKFVFIFDNVNDRLGVGCKDANSFLIGGDDGDNHHELEGIINSMWECSPYKEWTRIELFPMIGRTT